MLTLDEAKTHLRVDHAEQDEYILSLVAVAQEYIEGIITPCGVDGEPPVVPAVNETQRHAARLLLAHWYVNSEAVSEGRMVEVPYGVKLLLDSNRPGEAFI